MRPIVDIDVLFFEGYDQAQARAATEAFRRTLTQILERYGLPSSASMVDLADVDLELLEVEEGTPESVGRALARAVYREVAS